MSLVDKETRALLADFLREAIASTVSNPSQISFERMRLTDGVIFNVSDTAFAAQAALVGRLVKKLGPVRGHRSDIEPVIWAIAAKLVTSAATAPSQVEVDQCLKDIEANSGLSVQVIKPCNNIQLAPPVRKISIGPVTIRNTASYLSSLRKRCLHTNFSLGGLSIQSASSTSVTLPHVVWEVELIAAAAVREEQVAWLIDVALSALRYAVLADDLGRMAPTVGKVEADAIEPHNPDHNRLTLGPDGRYSIGGWTLPSRYELGTKARRALQTKRVKERIHAIFNPPKASLAERFGQGLGWMTRGRKSSDRPSRLLYFFTAIESLLSDSDKTAPIVQTVSRHAAVLLSDDNSRRLLISKDIKTLYGLRSSLVHTGKRGIYDQDSNTIQYIAELLFQVVWEKIDLAMSHNDFVNLLSQASYGLKLKPILGK